MQAITHTQTPEMRDGVMQIEIQTADAAVELSTDEMDLVAGGPEAWNF